MVNWEHLLDLAQAEIRRSGLGAPRQTILCRAVSSAYYALFHHLLARLAAAFVPGSYPKKARVLFYRALEHGRTYGRCKKLGLSPLPKEERDFFGIESFPSQLCDFANEFVRLQDLRHSADYDPEFRISKMLAQDVVDSVRQAIAKISSADESDRLLFLSYLLLGLRR